MRLAWQSPRCRSAAAAEHALAAALWPAGGDPSRHTQRRSASCAGLRAGCCVVKHGRCSTPRCCNILPALCGCLHRVCLPQPAGSGTQTPLAFLWLCPPQAMPWTACCRRGRAARRRRRRPPLPPLCAAAMPPPARRCQRLRTLGLARCPAQVGVVVCLLNFSTSFYVTVWGWPAVQLGLAACCACCACFAPRWQGGVCSSRAAHMRREQKKASWGGQQSLDS